MTDPVEPIYEIVYSTPNKTIKVPASELEATLRQINQTGKLVLRLTIPLVVAPSTNANPNANPHSA